MSATGTLRGAPKNRSQAPLERLATSHIPRPAEQQAAHASPTPASSETGHSTITASRQKQTKRDEAIRKKIAHDLNKKGGQTARARNTRKAPPGTVLALRPSPALQVKPHITVYEAAQLMAAKREDCVLVTDDDDHIAGIFTAKDLAFRVVGSGLKAREATIADIMTKNPLCAETDTSATDALDLMVRKGFRHLPVMDENRDISGVLDITKCFYDAMEKLERAYSSSRKLYDALQGVEAELGANQPQQIIQYVEALRKKMSGPTLESVLDGKPPVHVNVRTSVKDAARAMRENHTTAVLVQDQEAITGIFTSKDVVLRVIAAGLDPATCSVVRVMTPHPDFAPLDMTIQAALRKMHDGHYLNLPVMGDAGEIVGMVDVLKLTYATLDQINSMQSNDSEGPAWNKFWMSLDNETESVMSGDLSVRPPMTPDHRSLVTPELNRAVLERGDSVLPADSASHHGAESPEPSAVAGAPIESMPFPFKFKAPGGRMHRVQIVGSSGIVELVNQVAQKLGSEVEAIGGVPDVTAGSLGKLGFALSYLDNEGDSVSITTDQDLLDAINLAHRAHREKVDLFVHDPEQAPLPAAMDPHPGLAKPPLPIPSNLRERKQRYGEGEDEGEDEQDEIMMNRRDRRRGQASSQNKQQVDQLIAGVSNDLLLPGAIATLAIVILGVFTIGRASSR